LKTSNPKATKRIITPPARITIFFGIIALTLLLPLPEKRSPFFSSLLSHSSSHFARLDFPEDDQLYAEIIIRIDNKSQF
jgi:hypothetical protein